MTRETQRRLALERIQQNIARHGHHVYVVTGAPIPHFTYTIGLHRRLGAEFVMAGAYYYSSDEAARIMNEIATRPKVADHFESSQFEIAPYGRFSIRLVDPTWVIRLMLGALDYYQVTEIRTFQVLPDKNHWTVDIPDLARPWSPNAAPAWRWLDEPWTYPIPSKSVAATNIGALRGERVTEAMRWEDDEWELFAGAGPDVPRDEIRVVPIGILLAADDSLSPVVNLRVGSGLWRDAISEWRPWDRSSK